MAWPWGAQVFACRSATVHEEAMLAVGALTYTTGRQFIKYMDRFFPVLEQGLTNHQARSARHALCHSPSTPAQCCSMLRLCG